eukprot:GHUV01038597.1.p1 GENE.GHUV01038597.1~~GHUV01038597.1.p1  ORF type:complete len:101 (+),score=16.15 GHUV01038597.1:247-549(+)
MYAAVAAAHDTLLLPIMTGCTSVLLSTSHQPMIGFLLIFPDLSNHSLILLQFHSIVAIMFGPSTWTLNPGASRSSTALASSGVLPTSSGHSVLGFPLTAM